MLGLVHQRLKRELRPFDSRARAGARIGTRSDGEDLPLSRVEARAGPGWCADRGNPGQVFQRRLDILNLIPVLLCLVALVLQPLQPLLELINRLVPVGVRIGGRLNDWRFPGWKLELDPGGALIEVIPAEILQRRLDIFNLVPILLGLVALILEGFKTSLKLINRLVLVSVRIGRKPKGLAFSRMGNWSLTPEVR